MNKHINLFILSLLFCITAHGAENNFELHNLQGGTPVVEVTWNADGTQIATVSRSGTVRTWDSFTGKVLDESKVGHNRTAAFSPTDPNIIAYTRGDSELAIRDTREWSLRIINLNKETDQEQTDYDDSWDIQGLRWNPSGTQLLAKPANRNLAIYDLESGAIFKGRHCAYYTRTPAWGTHGLACLAENGMSLYPSPLDLASLDELLRQDGGQIIDNQHKIPHVATWKPNTAELAIANRGMTHSGSTVHIMNTDTYIETSENSHYEPEAFERCAQVLHDPVTSNPTSVDWHPSGDFLVTGTKCEEDGIGTQDRIGNSEVYVWDVNKKTTLARLAGHTDTVNDVKFSPDGSFIASASNDCTTKIWCMLDTALLATATNENEEE